MAEHSLAASDRHDGTVPGLATACPDTVAFTGLTEQYYPLVLRYLTRQLGCPETASDLTQDTFVAAYRHLDQLRDDAAFPGWLFQIARNQVRGHFRQQKLRSIVSLDWLRDEAGSVIPALRRSDETTAVHSRDDIQRTLDRLAPAAREALLLHALGGFTGREVAGILGISHAAARKRINRAEAEFRGQYERLTGEHYAPGE